MADTPPVNIRVEGAEQLAALSRRLKAQGETGKGLQKELRATIIREAKPVGPFVAVSGAQHLGHRGGLAHLVAGARPSVSVGTTSVRLKLRVKNFDLPAMDRGRLRHPVFGTGTWVTQAIMPRIFTTPFEQVAAPHVRAAVQRAVDDVAQKIEKG